MGKNRMSEKDVAYSVDLKKRHLKSHYEKAYKAWAGKYTDDRVVFCNIYERTMEAVEEMANVHSLYIWVAFNDKYAKEFEMLGDILTEFESEIA